MRDQIRDRLWEGFPLESTWWEGIGTSLIAIGAGMALGGWCIYQACRRADFAAGARSPGREGGDSPSLPGTALALLGAGVLLEAVIRSLQPGLGWIGVVPVAAGFAMLLRWASERG